ncbi:MAG TPA: class I SAM-dependent methyltransferase [Alphaproteobacteria bacterium]|nr:class I SAM-dependent methyltransferase [Alphaproteobacteria bacterium]
MNPWRQFWGRAHRIYVNDRHRAVHYRRVADDILSVLPDRAEATVLDYGCGDAFEAARVAARTQHLYLFDAVPEVVARLRERFAGQPRITVLGEAELAASEPSSMDLIVVNSVVQYLQPAELAAMLDTARRLLRAEGTLVVADVIDPDAGAAADIAALLRCAAAHGFLIAALGGLVATFFSDYRRLRQSVGLATYREAEFLRILLEAGFAARRRESNFGFNPARMTFLATLRR